MGEIYVTTTADSGAGSLRQAILDAQDGDVILFDSTVFPAGATTAILLSSHIAVNKQLTIDAGANETTPRVALDAQNNSRCLYLQPGANGTLRGFLFCNASNSTNGGAVYCSATDSITFTQCRFSNNQGNTGGGLSTTVAATITFDACEFSGNTANSNGGAVYCSSGATLTFDDCTFSGNTANSNGGGFLSTNTSQNTFNNCVFSGNSAVGNGGGLCSVSMSQITLNNCILTNNTSQNFGNAVRSDSTSRVVIVNCEIYDNTSAGNNTAIDVSAGGTSAVSVAASRINSVLLGATAALNIDAGITTCDALYLNRSGDNTSIVTFADGAALAVTTAATVPSGTTFTSAGRGYLATAVGLDFSAATLNNVVLCSYGAGASAFWEDLGVLRWDAADVTVPVLLEVGSESNGATQWETLIQTTGNAYTRYFPPHVDLRLFDGEKFLTTSTPDSRTYYYIGGAEGSFVAAADWSLTRGGYAIPEAPTVKDCVFIVGDVAPAEGGF